MFEIAGHLVGGNCFHLGHRFAGEHAVCGLAAIADCLVDTGFTKDRLDEMYEDGYTVDEVMHEWEWENDSEMHEWSAKSKAQLKEKGYL